MIHPTNADTGLEPFELELFNCYARLYTVSNNVHTCYPAKLIYFNFQPLEVVSRHRNPQLQLAENYSYLLNLRQNVYKS